MPFIPDTENERLKNAPVITPEQAQQAQQANPMQPSVTPNGAGAGKLPPYEYSGIPGVPGPGTTPQMGAGPTGGFTPDPKPTMGSKAWNRFWGTDIEDPMPWTRLATQIFGAISAGGAGAQVGAAMGAPLGPMGATVGGIVGGLGGSMAGVSAGSVAPEASMELSELLGVTRPGFREANGLTDDEMKTLLEGELLLELATGGAITMSRGLGRGISRMASKPGRAGKDLAETASEFDVGLMPVQIGNSKVARSFVNVMGQFPWIGTPLRTQGDVVEQQIKYAVEKLPLRIAPAFSNPAISRQIIDDVSNMSKRVDNYFKEAYTAIDDAATEAGVTIQPNITLQKADEVLSDIMERTPQQPGLPENKATKALEGVKTFIRSEIDPVRVDTPAGRLMAEQSFNQMRGLVDKIDEQIADLVGAGIPYKSRPVQLLQKLRNGAQLDMVTNAVAEDPARAKQIMSDYKELNGHFSETMQELFETAGAKRFRSISTAGVRGTAGKATRQSIDNLSRILLSDESPSIIGDIEKLVSKDTFRNMTAQHIRNKLTAATKVKGSEGFFDANAFAKLTGLNDKTSQRYLQTKKMLETSGGLSIKDLEDVVKMMNVVSDTPLPNMSQFVARRASLGGFRAIKNAVLPGALIGAGGAGGMAAGGATGAGVGTILTGLMVVAGSRAFSKILSDPLNARRLHFVLTNEIDRAAHKRAMLGIVRTGAQAMLDEGEITASEFTDLVGSGTTFVNEVYEDVKNYVKEKR